MPHMGLQALRNGEQFSLQHDFLIRHAQRQVASSLCLAGAPKGPSELQVTISHDGYDLCSASVNEAMAWRRKRLQDERRLIWRGESTNTHTS